jgi:hypothetical protein
MLGKIIFHHSEPVHTARTTSATARSVLHVHGSCAHVECVRVYGLAFPAAPVAMAM